MMTSAPKLTPQLMFHGGFDHAVALWREAFPNLRVTPLGPGRVRMTIAGQDLFLFDSPVRHAFDFTPAVSLVVETTPAEVDRIAGVLGRDGEVLMPLDAYDFSPRFTWVNDRFGVSWQIMAAA